MDEDQSTIADAIWAFLYLVAGLAFGTGMAWLYWYGGPGEHIHPSGNTVYLDGEACVINADPSVTQDEFLEGLGFCWVEFRRDNG